MLTAIASICIFLVVVLIHEAGHFFMAKSVGIRVNEFSIGMGPKVYQKEKNETKYSLRLLPIGGYVSMEGEDEESTDPNSFNNASVWSRIKVIVAGALMNFVLAIVLLTIVSFAIGTPTTEIEKSFNEKLMAGDKIVSINQVEIKKWEDITKTISKSDKNKNLQFVVNRDKENINIDIEPKIEDGKIIVGIQPKMEKNILTAIKNGFMQTKMFLMAMFEFIGNVFQGQVKTNDISGPVGVVKEIGNATKMGVFNVLLLAAFISVNLGFFNLLPIPALDGGRLLFLIIELVRGKPIDSNKEGMVHFVGFIVLMSLILFITYKDIVKLF